MGLIHSKLHLPEPNLGEGKENKRVYDFPPASSYTQETAIEEGQKGWMSHEERLDSIELTLKRGVTICNTIVDRINQHEQKHTDQQQKERVAAERRDLLESRLSELEARVLSWNQDQQSNQNQFQEQVQEEQIPIADEVQVGGAGGSGDPIHQGQDMGHQGQDIGNQGQDMGNQGQDMGNQGQDMGNQGQDMGHQGEGHGQRRKIRCAYCGNSLTEGPYIHKHIRFHCAHAPLDKRAVRRGVCPHCGKTLSVQTLKRHIAVPCTGRRMANND